MMNKSCDNFFATHGEHFLRIVVGLIFLFAGYGKLFGAPGIAGFTGMLDGMGIPLAGFFAVLVGIIEFVGGIFLVLGLWTRESAKALAVIMLVAIIAVHITQPWASGLRYPLLLFAALVYYIGHQPSCTLAACLMGTQKKSVSKTTSVKAAPKAAPKKAPAKKATKKSAKKSAKKAAKKKK